MSPERTKHEAISVVTILKWNNCQEQHAIFQVVKYQRRNGTVIGHRRETFARKFFVINLKLQILENNDPSNALVT